MENTVTLTEWMIDNAATNGCGYTRQQLAAVGVPWPPAKGWKRGLVGKSVPLSGYYTFCKVGGKKASEIRGLDQIAHELALCVWMGGNFKKGSRPKDAITRAKIAIEAVTKALEELESDMVEAESLVGEVEYTQAERLVDERNYFRYLESMDSIKKGDC